MADACHHLRPTRVLKVDANNFGQNASGVLTNDSKNGQTLDTTGESNDYDSIREAASHIRESDIPVAFPTETVYGLGADATRSSAVQGIFKAKQRPSDNPLIVHISSLSQLRRLLDPDSANDKPDPIPQIYLDLIHRFWPGPLTILLPLPDSSPFSPEVTAGLKTVGVRMPASKLALALIEAAGVPLAAPSANTSTRPSPTTAAHVLNDLNGRIDLILDGGPCTVGIESTVVDGLSKPPLILRPGGISIEELRECHGWENVQVGYELKLPGGGAPKAPGMKYKHYSPRARTFLLLYEEGRGPVRLESLIESQSVYGVVRTSDRKLRYMDDAATFEFLPPGKRFNSSDDVPLIPRSSSLGIYESDRCHSRSTCWVINLGPDPSHIARELFSALRALDDKGVSKIFVESLDPHLGQAGEAIMNRLRKAAEGEVGQLAPPHHLKPL